MKNLNESEVQWVNAFAKTQDFFKSFLLFYKVKNQLSNNQYYWLNLYINKAEEDGDEVLNAEEIAFLEQYHEQNELVKRLFNIYSTNGFLHKDEYHEFLNLKNEIMESSEAKPMESEEKVKLETKIIKIPCPHCSFLCSPQTDFCLKCGEPLPKLEILEEYNHSSGFAQEDYAEKNIIHNLEMLINKPIPLKKKFNVSKTCYVKEDDRITGLSLFNCGLSEFSAEILKLKSLKNLALRRNKIQQLPKSIGFLSNLEYLDMRINKLENLPFAIGLLLRLKTLNVSSNQLKEIPDSIGDLLLLKKLNLSNNTLKCVPESLGNIEGLEMLNLKANYWIQIPESIEKLKKNGLELSY